MLLTVNDKSAVKNIINQLSENFSIKQLNLATTFLNIQIKPTVQGCFLTQQHYVENLLYKVGLWHAKLVSNPLPSKASQFQVHSKPFHDSTLY